MPGSVSKRPGELPLAANPGEGSGNYRAKSSFLRKSAADEDRARSRRRRTAVVKAGIALYDRLFHGRIDRRRRPEKEREMRSAGEWRAARYVVLAAMLALGAGGCNIIMPGGDDDDDDDTTGAADASAEGGRPDTCPNVAGSWVGNWADGNGAGALEVTIDPFDAPLKMMPRESLTGVWNAIGGSGRAPFEGPVSEIYLGEDHDWHVRLALIYDNGCGADLVRADVLNSNHINGWYGGDCCGAGGTFEMFREGTPRPDGGVSPIPFDGSFPPPRRDASTDYRRDASSDW
jgi:hypothetical protein